MEVFILIAFIGLGFYIGYQKGASRILNETNRQAALLKSMMLPVPEQYKQILSKYFTYYQKLSESNKVVFEKKLVRFLHTKRFIPRGINEVTIEAKVLIGASAVQLTFGLPEFYFEHFNKILVYPNDYYSAITKRYHKGEVNPRFGIIVLSWQSFVDGYIDARDSFNVGLHEMAHALRLEAIIRNEEYEFFDADLLARFESFSEEYCSNPDKDPTHFLRPYACTNVHEFFSVSVENFFERPDGFKESIPELYDILVRLLNQDPLVYFKQS